MVKTVWTSSRFVRFEVLCQKLHMNQEKVRLVRFMKESKPVKIYNRFGELTSSTKESEKDRIVTCFWISGFCKDLYNWNGYAYVFLNIKLTKPSQWRTLETRPQRRSSREKIVSYLKTVTFHLLPVAKIFKRKICNLVRII